MVGCSISRFHLFYLLSIKTFHTKKKVINLYIVLNKLQCVILNIHILK